MSELLREIEEDIRAERARNFWQRFGKSMVWISVAVVAGTAAGVLWKDYRHSQGAKQTSLLMAGVEQMDRGQYDEAVATFAQVEQGNSAHWGIALLKKAEAEMARGDTQAAKATLQSLAGKNSGDIAPFADLAKLKLAKVNEPVDKQSPFHLSLMEMRAWTLMEEGKKDEAAKLLETLHDDQTLAASMRNRVTLALQAVAPEKLASGKAHE